MLPLTVTRQCFQSVPRRRAQEFKRGCTVELLQLPLGDCFHVGKAFDTFSFKKRLRVFASERFDHLKSIYRLTVCGKRYGGLTVTRTFDGPNIRRRWTLDSRPRGNDGPREERCNEIRQRRYLSANGIWLSGDQKCQNAIPRASQAQNGPGAPPVLEIARNQGRWFSRHHSSFDHLPYLFFQEAELKQYFFVVLTELWRVESHTRPLAVEHQRQRDVRVCLPSGSVIGASPPVAARCGSSNKSCGRVIGASGGPCFSNIAASASAE